MPTLCAVAEAQPRRGNRFPDFTVQRSPRPAEEEHLCSLRVLMEKGKDLKYPLLVHPWRRSHHSMVTAHIRNAGLKCMARCFSKGGMCSFIYLQQCFTLLSYSTSSSNDAQPAGDSCFGISLCHRKDAVNKS